MEDHKEMNVQEGVRPTRTYRPRFRLYKPNPKGTGCAMELTLHPAHDLFEGSIMARLSNQLTVGDRRGPNPTFPSFDWENAIPVKLGFSDLSKMLQVFRGECETLEEDKGLYHRSPSGLTHIMLKHLIEPTPGYSLMVSRVTPGAQEGPRAHIFLSSVEASGVTAAVEQSLGYVCFGIPMVLEHDTTAYRQAVREMRHDSAS